MLLHHFQSLPLDFSITQNPSQNQLFLKECWFFHEKSSFSCRVGNFFTSQYGTYECVLWVLNTLGHYLKLLGPNFWYRFLFWKKSIFSTSMASKRSYKPLLSSTYNDFVRIWSVLRPWRSKKMEFFQNKKRYRKFGQRSFR